MDIFLNAIFPQHFQEAFLCFMTFAIYMCTISLILKVRTLYLQKKNADSQVLKHLISTFKE